MKKNILLLILSIFVSCSVLSAGIALAAQDVGPEEIILRTLKNKKPAKFPHRKHQGVLECGDCHHSKGDDGKQASFTEGMEIKKCITCHNKTDGIVTDPKLQDFKGAAHGKCKTCHKDRTKAGLKAGPTKCSGCHPKKLK